MKIKLVDLLFYLFVIFTFVSAFYNAYLGWFKDEFSQKIMYLTFLSMLFMAGLITKFSKMKSDN
ncbi:hypothetical protein EFE41_09460 [Methanohalophilus portucalensis FDF-1]|uniref:Uncharacterized protein n=2 Tax=Methanohalophilus portucalensis TaxID=39664 RepID=A0A1X7NQ03_9EURY|nr:hypothetical protein BKM01_00145 [Methanohalophilus portucalensis]RNI09525.1 hypothetical protein EFE41_09460 [Methanohalophilus portucalensis FDF-1]SMH40112.1 hypothetical protein SAMN06264941_1492 [Methanohalophilus portucalensis FDF-1]